MPSPLHTRLLPRRLFRCRNILPLVASLPSLRQHFPTKDARSYASDKPSADKVTIEAGVEKLSPKANLPVKRKATNKKDLPRKKKGKHPKETASPSVLTESVEHAQNIGTVALHREIRDFVSLIQPTPASEQLRSCVIAFWESEVRKVLGAHVSLKPFGSSATGLYLPWSDLDLVIHDPNRPEQIESSSSLNSVDDLDEWRKAVAETSDPSESPSEPLPSDESPLPISAIDPPKTPPPTDTTDTPPKSKIKGTPQWLEARQKLREIHTHIRKIQPKAWSPPLLVIPANVPIIKLIDRRTGIPIDISYGQLSGLPAVDYVQNVDTVVKQMVFLLKQLLKKHKLAETMSGGIGGYGQVLWVDAFVKLRLELCPWRRTGNPHSSPTTNPITHNNLGELFLDFCRVFGTEFDSDIHALMPAGTGSLIPRSKTTFQTGALVIIDPTDPFNNVTKGAFNYKDISKLLQTVHTSLVKNLGKRSYDLPFLEEHIKLEPADLAHKQHIGYMSQLVRRIRFEEIRKHWNRSFFLKKG
ncbi:hypothetical protein HK097_006781 [Rhizophlyctis rosea]|uniref:Poly(A) RNA polymerase mitochondrial-like central palm domain-containing protein n=1 Tax=Rhizophlyctis rosea TaxID=64517 RepID=A0AAD5SK53_9FUNG|nr:hypothetical protein HK097_006781 [Rhizophlyctis rosea]